MGNITTVQRTRNNSFVKAIREPNIRRELEDGNFKNQSFKGNAIPGTVQRKRIKFDGKKKRFPVTIPKSELNELVKEMSLFDEEGNMITECNVANIRDAFFRHEEMVAEFVGGAFSYDEESPKGKIWKNYMENSTEFKTKQKAGAPVGMIAGGAEFAYVENNQTLEQAEEKERLDEEAKAMELIVAMGTKKQVDILRAMGVKVDSSQLDPDVIKRELIKKVIHQSDGIGLFGKRNITHFIELSESTDADISLKSLIKEARDLRIITKQNNSGIQVYKFGEIPLGSNLAKVEEFLSDKDNADIFNEIMEAVEYQREL